MSRIGFKPLELPEGVEVKVDGLTVNVKGPKGELSRTIHEDMIINIEDNQLVVERPSESKLHRSLHVRLVRSLPTW